MKRLASWLLTKIVRRTLRQERADRRTTLHGRHCSSIRPAQEWCL
jgi:hypothetical protein